MAGFIGRAGLSVDMANNGWTALGRAAALRPHVALLDYNLPDMTGVQLAEQLRALLPETAILLMSGRIDGLSEKTLQALGITVFVNKPLPMGALRQAVLKLVRNGPVIREDQPRQGGWLAAGVGGTRH
jgi:CheY-like chemotaxis protein